MGLVCCGIATAAMNHAIRQLIPVLIGVSLLLSSWLAVWSLFRADSYRHQTELVFAQAMEIRSRVSQSREKLLQTIGYVELSAVTGQMNPRLLLNIQLLSFNLKTLARLDFAPLFIGTESMIELRQAIKAIETDIRPQLAEPEKYDLVLRALMLIDNFVIRLAGETIETSQALSATSRTATAAANNRLMLFSALSAIILCAIALYQQNRVKKREHIKSFSMLFAHMTRTRIAALRLFLGYLDAKTLPPPEMTDAALRTILELDSITEALTTIGHARAESKPAPLGKLIEEIVRNCKYEPRVEADVEARAVCVPASQFHLLIDELVGNAINAVAARANPAISIKASVRKRLLRPSQLILTVGDNGTGMSPDLLARARDPFFSTKAGVHVGLGLTNCVELVKSMSGKLDITSAAGIGTSVRITYTI